MTGILETKWAGSVLSTPPARGTKLNGSLIRCPFSPPIATARNVNPGPPADPRDSWPAWTDADRWELGSEDDSRPTPGPGYEPPASEEAEAAKILSDDSGPTDAEWDAMADDAYARDRVCSGPIF